MQKNIAFLRGINVGNIRIKMSDLKAAFESMGCQNVKTYLQTGNVVFESESSMDKLKPLLQKGLSDTFHYEAYILLYEYGSLGSIIANYPMQRDDSHHAYVIFTETEEAFIDLKKLALKAGEESDFIKAGDKILYWKVPIGKSLDTPFSKLLGKAKHRRSATVRNLNTLEKMV